MEPFNEETSGLNHFGCHRTSPRVGIRRTSPVLVGMSDAFIDAIIKPIVRQ